MDPSQFSSTLMKTCERLVKEGRFVPSSPVGVLTTSYYELLQNKVPLLGKQKKHLFWYPARYVILYWRFYYSTE